MTNPATNSVTIEYVEENGKHYCIRNGYRIEVESLPTQGRPTQDEARGVRTGIREAPPPLGQSARQAKNINTYPIGHSDPARGVPV